MPADAGDGVLAGAAATVRICVARFPESILDGVVAGTAAEGGETAPAFDVDADAVVAFDVGADAELALGIGADGAVVEATLVTDGRNTAFNSE